MTLSPVTEGYAEPLLLLGRKQSSLAPFEFALRPWCWLPFCFLQRILDDVQRCINADIVQRLHEDVQRLLTTKVGLLWIYAKERASQLVAESASITKERNALLERARRREEGKVLLASFDKEGLA